MTLELTCLTQDVLHQEFDYDGDGFLLWRKRRRGRKQGTRAGTVIKGKRFDNHRITFYGFGWETSRLIFMWHHDWLPEVVDHINRDRLDNRIENLRAATQAQNQWNYERKGKNVSFLNGSWCASVMVAGHTYRKYFSTRCKQSTTPLEIRRAKHQEFFYDDANSKS